MTQQHDDWQIVLRQLHDRRISAVQRGDDRELEHVEEQLDEFYADPGAYMRGHNQHVSMMEEAAHDH